MLVPATAALAQEIDLGAATVDVPLNLVDTPLKLDTDLPAGTAVGVRVAGSGAEPVLVTVDEGGRLVAADLDVPSSGTEIELTVGDARRTVEVRAWPGWFSILPPLIAIALALIFKDVLIALFIGIVCGVFMLESWRPDLAIARTIDTYIIEALADSSHVSIIVFTCLLGGMVGLLTKSGGTHGIVERLTPWATSARRGQIATWFMGLAVFFDDYANTLIVGPTMRPITDRLRISREKLAYIVDSTAAPVVCLFPISTWVGFEIGLIGDAFTNLGIESDAYSAFLDSIPYRFYPFFALTLVLVLAITRRDFGAMRRAERRASEEGKVLGDDARPIADYSSEDVEPPEDAPKRAINAVLPILTVVFVTLFGLWATGSTALADSGAAVREGFWPALRQLLEGADSYVALLWASLAGALVALLLPLTQRILRVEQAVGALVAGIKSMMMALIVLTLAWSLSAVCDNLSTAQWLAGVAEKGLDPHFLPAVTFVLAAAIAFATGSSWGTLGIMEPLIIPIAHTLSVQHGHGFGDPIYQIAMMGSIGAVLTGAVWGDHCSPISDTTILSSMATGCDHVAHVRTQLPYALATGGLAIFAGAVPAAYGVPPWVLVPSGMALVAFGVWFLGRRQDAADGRADDPGESATA